LITELQVPIASNVFSQGAKLPTQFYSHPSKLRKPEATYGVKQQWNGVATPGVWNVKSDDLEQLPLDFPLERTHREIHNCDASVVSERICSVLRDLSIEAKFCSKRAKAKCKNADLVGFVIRLYAGGIGGTPVIVEVQRRSGSARSFMISCRAILAAAEGAEIKKLPSQLQPPIPIDMMKCIPKSISGDTSLEEDASSALNSAWSMLQSQKRDIVTLGLENLIALTDPLKTSANLSLHVAKSLLFGNFDAVRGAVLALVQRDSFVVDDSSEVVDEDGGPVDIEGNIQYLAVKVFANSLLVYGENKLIEDNACELAWLTENLVPLLLNLLKQAYSNPSLAFQAASCLCRMMESSQSARSFIMRHGGAEILKEACTIGASQHELLAAESERCLRLL
jgi:hypothetical protein